MFALKWSTDAKAQYEQIKQAAVKAAETRRKKKRAKSSKQEGLFKQVHKALEYLSQNPKHPSLSTHKFRTIRDPSGKHREVFEAYAQNMTPGAYRIVWCYGPGRSEMTILAVIAHP